MSFTSTTSSSTSSSDSMPFASPPSQPLAIAATMRPDTASDPFGPSMSRSSSQASNSHFSSPDYSDWTYGSAVRPTRTRATSYVSDEDLFGDDIDAYLSEAPAPPRPAEQWLAQPVLPPVQVLPPLKPRRCSAQSQSQSSKRRASSGSKRKG